MFNVEILALSPQPVPTNSGSSIYTIAFFMIFIVFIIFRRVYRGMHGARFSMVRLFRLPAVYTIITILSSIFLPLEYVFIALGIGVAGLATGIFFGDTATFYYQDSRIFYRRAPVIIIVWLGAFLARITVELVYSGTSQYFGSANNTLVGIIVDLLLAGSTGLLLGETIRTYRGYQNFRQAGTESMGIEGTELK